MIQIEAICFICFICLIFGLLLTVLACEPKKSAKVEVTRLSDNLYKLDVDNFVNIMALTGPEGALLVDTGFEETAKQVQSILDDQSGGNISIKYIINTHSDYDHIAGNPILRKNAVVMSHINCKTHLIEYAEPDIDIPFDKEISGKLLTGSKLLLEKSIGDTLYQLLSISADDVKVL